MPKSKRNDEPVKLDRDVVRVARIVCAYRNLQMAEYLSELLRPLVTADHEEELRKLQEQSPADTEAESAPARPRRRRD
jgi:hypothetical protein